MGVGVACGGIADTHHLGLFFGHNMPMRFPHRLPVLLLTIMVFLAGCGSEGTAASDESTPASTTGTSVSTSAITVTSASAPATTTLTTEVSSTTTTTEAPTTVPGGVQVTREVGREVLLTSIILAESDGKLLGTVFDPESFGCEGLPADYFAVVGADGAIRATSTGGEAFQYAGFATASPNRQQLLEVSSCEGFLGGVTVYDVEPSLDLSNPVEINIGDAISGDATWNADGFITMILSDQSGDIVESESESESESEDETEPSVRIEEYLVNPRTGDRTLFGTLETFSYGAIRTPDGTQVYSEWDLEPSVVLIPRGSADERRFSANNFALSPDASQLVIWDSIFDTGDGGEIELVNMDTGAVTTVGEGRALRVVWRNDSTRFAFSSGNETFVYDLATGETASVGTAEPLNCSEDSYITWGRIPMVFSPDGDLYVGDPVCSTSAEGFPVVEYQVSQLSLS